MSGCSKSYFDEINKIQKNGVNDEQLTLAKKILLKEIHIIQESQSQILLQKSVIQLH